MSRTLIRGGCVLTMGRSNFPEADVLIQDDVIAEIGTGLRARDAEVVDATDCIVMPGFVDTHRHTWESLFRNIGDAPGTSPDHYGPHQSPDDLYAATLLGLLTALDSGTTTVVDWCGAASTSEHIDAALQAHSDSRIRSVFVLGTSSWNESNWGERLQRAAAAETGELTTVAAGANGDVDLDATSWALARDLGLRIHAHAGAADEARGAIARLGGAGLLGDDVTLVHCSHLDDSDLETLKSSGVAVSITPSTEMAMGIGTPPIEELESVGVRPGLGVGAEQLTPGDMFAQMRAVNSLQHATVFDRKLAGKAGLPRLMSTRDVIKYATVDGARVAGLSDVTGVIEPGKQADLIVLRGDRPNIAPINDPIGAVVWGMDTSNLDWVFVDGRVAMRHGVLEADVPRARDLATAAQGRVTAAASAVTGSTSGGRE